MAPKYRLAHGGTIKACGATTKFETVRGGGFDTVRGGGFDTVRGGGFETVAIHHGASVL